MPVIRMIVHVHCPNDMCVIGSYNIVMLNELGRMHGL